MMGVSLRTIQDWEQGRRKPSGPALALLRIAEQKAGDIFGIDVGVGGLRIEDQILKTQNSKLKTQNSEV